MPGHCDPTANLHIARWEVVPKNAASRIDEICVGDWDPATSTCLNALPPSYDPVVGIVAEFGGAREQLQTKTTTLDDVLDRLKVAAFDFLSMDIELNEPAALRGFSIGRFRPSLVCIEAHPEVRQAILDYFTRNRYVPVGKYLRADRSNLWFTPLN